MVKSSNFRCGKCLYFIISIIVLFSAEAYSQKRHSVYLEGLGNAYLAASINYELRLMDPAEGPGIRIGFDLGGSLAAPILANYIIGSEKHKLEIGAGATLFIDQVSQSGNVAEGPQPTGVIAYRYHGPSGFLLRAGWTPILMDRGSAVGWGGVSIGWQF